MSRPECPMSRTAVVEAYFLEHRAKVLDLAAFLDRVDRAKPAPGERDDFRVIALRQALGILADGGGDRARRVHEALSDPTDTPLPSAAGLKGAFGAWPGP